MGLQSKLQHLQYTQWAWANLETLTKRMSRPRRICTRYCVPGTGIFPMGKVACGSKQRTNGQPKTSARLESIVRLGARRRTQALRQRVTTR